MTSRWPAPPLPLLPDRGLPVRLYDTATGFTVPTAPDRVARMYVCGITPYDATHLGHATTYIAFDLLNRAWRDGGHDVRYVQNVTDVDDPLLERAAATGRDWRELAGEQTDLFADDMVALAVLPPDSYVGAVDAIPLVVEATQRLLAAGHAYPLPGHERPEGGTEPDGDIYFSVHADPRFGSISGLDEASMIEVFAERGGDPERPGKKHPLDCLLWRVARPGEPSWDGGTLGHGRPGWHIECTAIALHHLGMTFDVQGGGSDLVFPHHEMGAAEGHLLAGSWPYARAYAHVGMVGLDGHKMSKSRGNLVLVSQLRRDGAEPAAIRLAILSHHYRSDWEWTPFALDRANLRLATWRAALAAGDSGPADEHLLLALRERLADDLDAPGAVKAVDRWAASQLAAPPSVPQDDRRHPVGAERLAGLAIRALLGVEV
ncbi:MAG: L-cysteine:1D-myo-inositol 2-amino-2-deoxy-alpha-D-glucopyranoside ligase [Actinomycetota bacterium]|nr:L-cysteine:1D-myo-inositol 2-amino-2-deoxy-alpha-D-glucopyranoside ligase [Actinomycetota bacterium]